MALFSRGEIGMILVGVVYAALAAGCGEVKRPDGGKGLLPVGAVAPSVTGEDANRREVRLDAVRGQPAVVYFYPRDGTPGCTKEACAFRDAWKRFDDAKVVVIGVSTDSPERHRAFQDEHKLPFALASDEDGKVGEAYGVRKNLWGYDRVTFLVGKDGKVARVWPNVDPGVHASEVLGAAAALP